MSASSRADDTTFSIELDMQKVAELRRRGPESAEYAEYAAKLRKYAIGTLLKQWHTGGLHQRIQKKFGRARFPDPPSHWTENDDIHSIIVTSVMAALGPFMEENILRGGWKPERGASIGTYFVGQCVFVFIREWRTACRAEGHGRGRIDLEPDVVAFFHRHLDPGPESVVLDRTQIRQLLSLAPPVTRTIIYLRSVGTPQRVIAKRLHTTEREVAKALKAFRRTVERERKQWR